MPSLKSVTKKTEKLYGVSNLIIQSYIKRPDLKLNLSRLAQKAGVSRAWIYKYLGSSQEQIILSAIDVLAPLISESSKPVNLLKTRNEWVKSLLRSLQRTLYEVEQYEHLFHFYFLINLRGGPFAERVKYHEKEYMFRHAIPQICAAFGCTHSEASSLAQIVFHIRTGLMFAWLTEKERSPAKRAALLKLVRTRILDQLAKGRATRTNQIDDSQ